MKGYATTFALFAVLCFGLWLQAEWRYKESAIKAATAESRSNLMEMDSKANALRADIAERERDQLRREKAERVAAQTKVGKK